MRHVFKLGEEESHTLQEIGNSIVSWSLELGKLQLRIETTKSHLFGNYEARQELMRKAVQKAGFDLSKVGNISMGQEGQVMVEMLGPQEEDPSGKPPGSTVDGVQTGPAGNTPPETSSSEESPPAS